MKNNQKGFTLIELLAVIVILAVIALISTPIILNVVEESRKNAAVDKAYGVIEAVKLAYTQNQIAAEPVTGKESITVAFGSTQNGEGEYKETVGDTKVKVSGDTPESGKVIINVEDGSIKIDSNNKLKFGDYYCQMKKNNNEETSKVECSKEN